MIPLCYAVRVIAILMAMWGVPCMLKAIGLGIPVHIGIFAIILVVAFVAYEAADGAIKRGRAR